jgi:hypothetical protein
MRAQERLRDHVRRRQQLAELSVLHVMTTRDRAGNVNRRTWYKPSLGLPSDGSSTQCLRLSFRPIIGGRPRGRLLTWRAFRMARPGLVGLLPWSALRMPWAFGCVGLMARREFGLAGAAFLCVALSEGRRG